MTITIADGRGALWQWDTGRRVKITDGDGVKQIHYQNKCFGRSVDVDVGADGTAIIPDELLQDWHPLTAYAYVTDDAGGYTKVQTEFVVHKRARPSDYVYTPTERAGFDRLRAEIGDLADLTTKDKSSLVGAVNEVLESGGADWAQNDPGGNGYVKNRPGGYYTPSKESITTDEDVEGYVIINKEVGEQIDIAIDGEIKTYTVADFGGGEKYFGDSLQSDEMTEGFTVIFDETGYVLINLTGVSHKYEFDALTPVPISASFVPKSVVSKIDFDQGYGHAAAENARIDIPVADDVGDDFDSGERNRVWYSNDQRCLFVLGKFAQLFNDDKEYKFDSRLDSQTIKNVLVSNTGKIIDVILIDIVDYREYHVLLRAMTNVNTKYVDGRITRKCAQGVAWINGHLFGLTIKDIRETDTFKNGDLEIKRIL